MEKTILVFDTKTQKTSRINDPLLLTDSMTVLTDSDSVLRRLKDETVIEVIFSSIEQALGKNIPEQSDDQIVTIADLSPKKQKLLETIVIPDAVNKRAANALKAYNIERWFHLFWFSPEMLASSNIRNFGKKGKKEIEDAVLSLFGVNIFLWERISKEFFFQADKYVCKNIPFIATSTAWQKFFLALGEDVSKVTLGDFLEKNGSYYNTKYCYILRNPVDEKHKKYFAIPGNYDFFEEILVEMRQIVSEYYERKYIEFVQSLPID